MTFEFFFGALGLISSGSNFRDRDRVESEWRLFTPLWGNLFKESTSDDLDTSRKGSPFKSSSEIDDSQKPIFSTSGILGDPDNHELADGILSSSMSPSSSSIASSVTSSGSTTTLIKQSGDSDSVSPSGGAKRYEFLDSRQHQYQASFAGSGHEDKSAPSFKGLETKFVADETSSTAQLQPDVSAGKPSRFRVLYCRTICIGLWLQVFRFLAGLLLEKSILTLDFYYLGKFKIHFLVPNICLACQAAALSLIFIRNNHETNWLVPFHSSKDFLIRSRSSFKPKMEDYGRRINISICLALALAVTTSASLAAYLTHSCYYSVERKEAPVELGEIERMVLMFLLCYDVVWAIYSSHICLVVSFYFNLICSIMKSRFRGISKVIEDLAESNTSRTTNQARKITVLYLEHNEACELLDESNDFWQYLIFFTYFTYVPAYCYCLYNLFFDDSGGWSNFITWVIHTHTGFIILMISFSAAGVSTEAHAPYTSLHTLSLIQLPLDVEVNISTFLHRVRGLTIGYSCYDLFAITNASMSNTAAACASYFLIVADFSRSSVFTLVSSNSSAASSEQALASTAAGYVGTSPAPALAG